jgi:hypothetical protein
VVYFAPALILHAYCEGDLHPKAVNHARRTKKRLTSLPVSLKGLQEDLNLLFVKPPSLHDRGLTT